MERFAIDGPELIGDVLDVIINKDRRLICGQFLTHGELSEAAVVGYQHGEAQRRLADYQRISDEVEAIANSFNSLSLKASWFELVQHPVQGAYQMNRKFLMAQLNQELLAEGRTAEANWAARQMEAAYDSIDALNRRYNEQLDGKWRGMMALAPAFRALDLGQMLQKVIIDWGGLQQSYLGPSVTWHPLQSWMISEQPPSLP